MRLRQRLFLRLALAAFGFVIAGFVVRGFGQLLLDEPTSKLLSTPFLFGGFALAGLAAVLSTLVKLGVIGLEEPVDG
jgi:uncharacterized membrane protein